MLTPFLEDCDVGQCESDCLALCLDVGNAPLTQHCAPASLVRRTHAGVFARRRHCLTAHVCSFPHVLIGTPHCLTPSLLPGKAGGRHRGTRKSSAHLWSFLWGSSQGRAPQKPHLGRSGLRRMSTRFG